jgi:hypothetical protein
MITATKNIILFIFISFPPALIQKDITVKDILCLIVNKDICTLLDSIADIRSIEYDVRVVTDIKIVAYSRDCILDLSEVVRSEVQASQSSVLIDSLWPI